MRRKRAYMFNVHKNQQSRQTIGPVIFAEKIKMWTVDGLTKSDGNSSHGLKARWAKNYHILVMLSILKIATFLLMPSILKITKFLVMMSILQIATFLVMMSILFSWMTNIHSINYTSFKCFLSLWVSLRQRIQWEYWVYFWQQVHSTLSLSSADV